MDDSNTRCDIPCVLYVQWRGNQRRDRALYTGSVPGCLPVFRLSLVYAASVCDLRHERKVLSEWAFR